MTTPFSPSPEFSLLLTCCRPAVSDELHTQQQGLLAEVDTDRFIALVDRHRVAPMVCHHLLKLPRETLPSALAQALVERQQANVFRQLEMTREQVRLHAVLQSAGIDYVTLKGLPLAQQYFGDAGLRTSKDIDVLVEPEKLDVTIAALLAAGYVPIDGFDQFTRRQRAHWISVFHHCSFEEPVSGVLLELHWRPVTYPDILAGIAFTTTPGAIQYVDFAGRQIPLLGPDEMLLYLCTHGTMHQWFRLKWVFDLPVVLESREWDWPALFAKAEKNRCAPQLALGLLAASQFCAWGVPLEVQVWLAQQSLAQRSRQDVLDAVLMPESYFVHIPPPAIFWRRLRYKARFVGGLGGWLYNFKVEATSAKDWLQLPLPDALFPLYFVLRPFLWLWRFVRHRIQNLAESSGSPAQ